ncbi:MAG: bifunctional riboflavin kinase/FAD synthetase [Candidatus Electryonea clarkiae]|nr:bifunctional riboflavin kinase/FAD synthetase [Candidatus Electryonea clarkiae]MDP8286608.1 bifunctional riboflavin kinase/FAD synthetase [Candidatus Electryonea clarkiae]
MKVIHLGRDSFEKDANAVVTIGTFDGVHLGHRSIFDRLQAASSKTDGQSTVLTFDLHPQHVLGNRLPVISILTPLEEKIRKLESIGIDRVVILPFDKEFANLSALEFLEDILVRKIGLKCLVVGFNHSFGRNREGNIDFLHEKSGEFGFDLDVVDAETISGIAISSTKIRKALNEGHLELANRYLGSIYRLAGEVVRGNSRGKSLGYPTANIRLFDSDQLIPAEGVYAIRILVESREYSGVGSIGRSETFGNNPLQIEAHLFDFDGDLYGKKLIIELISFLRPQKKFGGVEELIQQMDRDKVAAKRVAQTIED